MPTNSEKSEKTIDPDSVCDLVVIGGGPAGLMAAITAGRRGRRVIVLERRDRAGGKLPVTGGGHCNLSAMVDEKVYFERFNPQGRFLADALRAFGPTDLADFLAAEGVPCRTDETGRLLPLSGRAMDVVEALLAAAEHAGAGTEANADACTNAGIEILTGARVEAVEFDAPAAPAQSDPRAQADAAAAKDKQRPLPRVRAVRCADGRRVACSAALIACGGMTYPALGSTGDGYALAAAAGYALTPPRCALAGVHLAGGRLSDYAGLTLSGATLTLRRRQRGAIVTRGSLLITHEGLSGPPALDISTHLSARLAAGESPTLLLAAAPQTNLATWQGHVAAWRREYGARQVFTLLAERVGRATSALAMDLMGLPRDLQAAHAPADLAEGITRALTAAELEVVAVDPPDKAMLTAGGVSLKQIDPRTLAGRLTRGLYFAGEVVDLDGPTGGYNLQWAFSSGHLAGQLGGEE